MAVGMVFQTEVHIEVDGDRPLKDVEMICLQVEMEIRTRNMGDLLSPLILY